MRPGGWRGRVAEWVTRVTGPALGEHLDRDAEAAARAGGLGVRERTWLWRDVVVLLAAVAPPAPTRPTPGADPPL